jgi:outer membrane protein assembly factor BamB
MFGEHVYIQCDNDQASFLVALDKKTGDQAWRVDRDEDSNWATPYLWTNRLRTELVTAGGGRMRSYDPASGKLLWEMQGRGRTSITPVGDDELLYVESYDRLTGTNGVLAAIRPGASGDISLAGGKSTNAHVAWSVQLAGSRVASPLLYEDCLYLLDNQGGVVRCLNAKAGREHFRKRLPGATGFTASPVASRGRAFFVDHRGKTIVVEAGPELKIVATNDLEEMCWSSPAAAGDRLLIRTADHLYAIGAK